MAKSKIGDPFANTLEENGSDEDITLSASYRVKKLTPQFVDEVINITVAPNRACRIYFGTWDTDDDGEPIRVDSEIIMTLISLKSLSEALPQAIEAAQNAELQVSGKLSGGDS